MKTHNRFTLLILFLAITTMLASCNLFNSDAGSEEVALDPATLGPILFAGEDTANQTNGLYTVNPDGSQLQAVPKTEGLRAAKWSPDGQKIAAVGDAYEGNEHTKALFVYHIAANRLEQVTFPPASGGGILVNRYPGDEIFVWGPDGEHLYFSRARPESWEGLIKAILRVNLTTGRTDTLLMSDDTWYQPIRIKSEQELVVAHQENQSSTTTYSVFNLNSWELTDLYMDPLPGVGFGRYPLANPDSSFEIFTTYEFVEGEWGTWLRNIAENDETMTYNGMTDPVSWNPEGKQALLFTGSKTRQGFIYNVDNQSMTHINIDPGIKVFEFTDWRK